MKQVYLSDAIAAAPASSAATSVGNPSDGDPANGVEATAPGAYWFYQIAEELEAVINEGGLTPDVGTLTQLRDAIEAMIAAAGGFDTVSGDARYLRRSRNLGDVNSSGTARSNIGAAPIASPSFTGNPRAPTPAVGDDDTSIATTAFVDNAIADIPGGLTLATRNEHLSNNPPTNESAVPAYVLAMIERAIANLLDSPPGALDTLNELAAALGDDANFATTVNNAIALRARIASPTFTGTPAAPTQNQSNNSTRLSTTAYVRAAISALLASVPAAGNTLKKLYDLILLRATIASPVFTGNPRAPTPAAGDNDTSVATTAFVRREGDERYVRKDLTEIIQINRSISQAHGDIDGVLSGLGTGESVPAFGFWRIEGAWSGDFNPGVRRYGHSVSNITRTATGYLIYGVLVSVNNSSQLNPTVGIYCRATLTPTNLTYHYTSGANYRTFSDWSFDEMHFALQIPQYL